LTPAIWKLFSMPERQLPANRDATNTISRSALFRKTIWSAPRRLSRHDA